MVKIGKPSNMYPKSVYHCQCVAFQVKMCLIEGHYSLNDIIAYLNEKLNETHKIYASKCGNDEVVFSCREHMSLKSVCEENDGGKRCLRCMKTYLKTAYYCCYDHTNFDLPLSVKKDKKTLCLIVEKL